MKRQLVFSLALIFGCLTLGACVGKPGAAVESVPDGVTVADPSNSHSTTVIGDKSTTVSGPMGAESSSMTKGKLQETNGGGALKQRAAFSLGDLQAMLSAAADFDMAGIDGTFADGKLTHLHVDRLATSASAVQKAVNDGIAVAVNAWLKASDNERAVMEKQLDTQAHAGDTVAQGALAIITKLKGL